MKNDFFDKEPIMDSIYGVVEISKFEKRILSTKEMQRLRGIKQLGFVNLVYPNAEHSRFSHSIGVCHQAKLITDQIIKNLKDSKDFNKWRTDFKKPEIGIKNISITEIERITI